MTGSYLAVIENPPINLADPEFFYDLRWTLDLLDDDPESRIIVFESANPEFFLAHFDVVTGQDADHSPGPTGLPLWPDLTTRMTQGRYLSVAKIRGRARGVGSEFLLACDIRFASRERAVIGQPEVGLGLFPGGGGTERLPRLVGRARALEIVLGSDDFDAPTAERYGYVNRAIPDEELDAFVDRFARRIASFDLAPLAKGKALVNHNSSLPKGADLVASQDAFFAAFGWQGTSQRFAQLFERGFQQPGDVETRLGDVVGELGRETVEQR
jgi:enoyl-CoA hydratase/carnithine racemase